MVIKKTSYQAEIRNINKLNFFMRMNRTFQKALRVSSSFQIILKVILGQNSIGFSNLATELEI
jgi:hypothetical protein